jgi:flagellar protein FliL
MAAAAEAVPEKKGPSMVVQLGVLAVLTAVAIGSGWFAGSMMTGPAGTDAAHGETAHVTETTTSEIGDIAIVHLEPITTQLAAPSTMWARLEVSLVFAEAADAAMAEAVHQDFFAYMRTVKSHQLEGPSGYQHMRADLIERADIRSAGAVKDVLVRTLILE